MFVREKKVKGYRYLQLVENHREGKKVKQRVIATLGRVEELRDKGVIDVLIKGLSRFSTEVVIIKGYEASEIGAEVKSEMPPKMRQ